MSHSGGRVEFRDGKKYYFEYNGTSDVACPLIFETSEELEENWRNQEYKECTCDKHEEVTINADYGCGVTWEGRACRHCMVILNRYRDPDWEYHEEEYREYNKFFGHSL